MEKKIYAVKEWDDKIHYFKVNKNQIKILEDFKKADLIEGLMEIKGELPVESIVEIETSAFLSEEKKIYCIVEWDDSGYYFPIDEDQYILLKVMEKKEIFYSMYEA